VYDFVRFKEVWMSLLWKGVRIIAGIVVVWSLVANFLNLSMSFSGLPPREKEEIVIYEKLFAPIRFALFTEGYDGRNLGYVSARSGPDKPGDPLDDVRRGKLRYVAIPLILLPDPQGMPYLIGDYTGGDPIPESLEGFVKIHDDHSGLVLYKKVSQ
jgi:hypothetical protein